MMFLYSLKLFGSNWVKALKFFLYTIVIWGICFALLLPAFFAFKDMTLTAFKDAGLVAAFSGVFQGSLGFGIYNLINTSYQLIVEAFAANAGLVIYGLLVIFVLLPFLINVGKYTFCEMLHSYMTSKNKLGFFSALVKGLKKSLIFALLKTICNLVFFAVTFLALYGFGTIDNTYFIAYLLPVVVFVVLVLLFTINQTIVIGWMPALIVFDCNVFSAYHKGNRAVVRHFWATLATSMLYFVLFWLLIMIFGVYTMVVLVPFLTTLLCVYNMVMFFTSQGMRFYYNKNNIRTPKKLEEVDSLSKTAYIL